MKKKEKLLTTILVLIAIVMLVATSYSFFVMAVSNDNKQEVSITTGSVTLVFADGKETFGAAELEIGKSVEKTFVVTNNNEVEETFHFYFKDLVNTYLNGSLTYTLAYSEIESAKDYTPIMSNVNVPVGDEPMLRLVMSDLTVPAKKTYYYKLIITFNNLDEVNQTVDIDAELNTKFTITKGDILANHITDIYNNNSIVTNNGVTYNTDNVNKLIDDNNGNIRYYGSNPNNYVKMEDGTEWRIIGLFETELTDGTTKKLVKLISSDTNEGISYDSTSPLSSAWVDSDIRAALNSNSRYNSIIQKVNLHIESMESANIYTNQMLALEQAGPKVEGERKVLMYLSDYGYAADFNYCDKTIYGYSDASCTSNNWLYTSNSHQWSLNPVSGSNSPCVMLIVKSGAVFNNNAVNYPAGGRAVMFLDSGVAYTSGDGSQENPYRIYERANRSSNINNSKSLATLTALGLANEVKSEPTDYNMFNYTWAGYRPWQSIAAQTEEKVDGIMETQGIYAMEDDFGMSYYFRGPKTLNNIVKFGKYDTDMYYYLVDGEYLTGSLEDCQVESSDASTYCTDTYKYASAGDDMYWRIIRINGDGTLRLMYIGTSASSSENAGLSIFNASGADPKYTGYTYDNSAPNAGDGTASSIKKYLDTWYSRTMGEEDSNIALAQFYNDTSKFTQLDSDHYYYATQYRLDKYDSEKFTDEVSPSLKTKNTTELYGGKYTLKVGLINADELVISGFDGVRGSRGSNENLRPYTTDINEWRWSFSSFGYLNGGANIISTGGSGYMGGISYGNVRESRAVVPVINLTASYARQLRGAGSTSSPFAKN